MKRILIVEDSQTTAMIEKNQLSNAGFDVEIINDGLSALPAAEKIKPDAIILDVILPGMDGLTLFKKIRSLEQFKDTPVIITSTKPEATRLFKNKDINCFLEKPVSEELLISTIKEQLQIR